MADGIVFPKDFLWGSAQSAYQVEGNNYNNDWFEFEQIPGVIKNGDRCGESSDHYNLYESDFKLLRSLNQNALRTGIEWSRIVPEENVVNEDELEHYHRVIESLKKNSLTEFINILHFTIPIWFERKGGFLKTKNLRFFQHYCEVLAKNFPEVEFWNTINEPGVVPLMGYLYGDFPPRKKSLSAFIKVYRNMIKAHGIAYRKLKEHNPKSQVGIVKTIPYFFQKYHSRLWKKWVVSAMDFAYNQVMFNALKKGKLPFIPFAYKNWLKGSSDFFGLNYYDPVYFRFKFGIPTGIDFKLPSQIQTTQMGWGIYPQGLYEDIMRVKREFKGPIYITENGMATLHDEERQKFILSHLIEVNKAISDGADVKGFFYWSSLDNWEWAEGFEPRFGLIGIDYATKERLVRESARMYGEIAKDNAIPKQLLDKFELVNPHKSKIQQTE